MTLARWLILFGCIILFCSGLVHLLGYPHLFPVLAATRLDPGLIGALLALWASFSIQFLVLSPAMFWISRRPHPRNLLLFLSLIPVANAILMYHFVGPFIGSYLVSAGALLVVVGALLLPGSNAS